MWKCMLPAFSCEGQHVSKQERRPLLEVISVQVWDTNSLAAVCNFGLPDRVFALDMSQVAAVHCLIAVGSAEPQASAYPLCIAEVSMPHLFPCL